ncbi:hypothetical protein LNKW23_28370 [Paralimibaculum aggregatum]|uniref:Transglycosylase SLT domain-containing protein n=1 Tax=Paralimibaculum aggregatum TaxID=3036245 RepID=A0ABQ6LR24_9RHOB|nr:lytic transglycosylase domain-containing protein [Limibaculum sp. NKW23]GMG83624.1 hypothetical protein LNKW23_28370 [Limibaculum sp. NKW23]
MQRGFAARLAGILGIVAALAGDSAGARAALCREAAETAARRHGIPPEIMQAITLAETGTTRDGRRGPWPWTLNIEGEGRWFDSRREALAAAEAAIAAGRRSTDIGCFQINWRWHGKAFDSVAALLEPAAGADYAARFLKSLHAEAGNWLTAAGWYHSRSPDHAGRYRAVIARHLRRGDGGEPRLAAGRGADRPAPPRAAPVAGAPTAGGVRLSLLTRAAGGLLRVADR